MTPAFCRVGHDPDAGKYGDCMRAAVATLLDLDTEAVPHFFHDNPPEDTGMVRMREWLATVGYQPFFIGLSETATFDEILSLMAIQNPDTYYMLLGSHADGEHVVVCKGGEKVHDPSWLPTPLTGPMSHGYWMICVLAKA